MSLTALLLTIASSIGWASFDVLRKRLTTKVDTIALALLVNAVQVPGFVLWTSLDGPLEVDDSYWLYGLGSVSLNVLANVSFLAAVRTSHLSATIPLLGLTPVFTALLAIPMLQEFPTNRSWVGIGLVVLGTLGLNAGLGDLCRPWRLLLAFARERGSAYMAMVAALWSVTPVFDKLALRYASVGFHAAVLTSGVMLTLGAVLVARRQTATLRAGFGTKMLLFASSAAALAAFGVQLVAIQHTLVSLFEALKRGFGMIASVLSGRLFFHEAIALGRIISVALMVIGVLLLM